MENPSAFPIYEEHDGDGGVNDPGMTLLDYFAGQSLASGNCKTASEAYIDAENMLEERKLMISSSSQINETELLSACLELLNAPHQEHFAVRLNDEEMAALDKIKAITEKLTRS